MEPIDDQLRTALIRRVFVITGSGISVESGIPTFRDNGGYWRTHRAEELATPAAFQRDPLLVWTWYRERRAAQVRGVDGLSGTALVEIYEVP